MERITLFIFSLSCLFSVSSASVCVVSFWSEWNSCVGNCQFALRVRNRNVIRPPFPERTPDGRLAIRPCPSLYQVQTCIPPPCLSTNKNETLVNSVVGESIDAEVASVQKVVEEATERAHNEKLPQRTEAKSEIPEIPKIPPTPSTTHITASTTPPKIPSKEGAAIINEVNEDQKVDEPLQQLATTKQGKASVVEVVSSTQSSEIGRNSTVIQTTERPTEPPVKAQVSVDVADPKTVKSDEIDDVEERLKKLIEEVKVAEEVKAAKEVKIVKEVKEVKEIEEIVTSATASTTVAVSHGVPSVVEEDENSNATSVVNQAEAISSTSTSKPQLSTSTEQAITQDNLAVGTVAPKIESPAANASDAHRRAPTVKPYRRNTKPCGVPGGNQRCCRLSSRTECPDGGRPQSVMRWSRMAENGECQSYNYGYCGIDVELEEAPIKFEQNCYDLCFTPEEKEELEIFRGSQFRDGFRVRF